MRALLLAACLGAPDPEPLGRLELGPATPDTFAVEDAQGRAVATARVRAETTSVLHLAPGTYVVRGSSGSQTVTVAADETAAPRLPGARGRQEDPAPQDPPPAALPRGPSDARLPPRKGPAKPKDRPAWRAPLMSTFVPGLGHAWAGKPLWGVGILATTAAAVSGAVVLGLQANRSDGATPSDASDDPDYGRLGGFAALSSVAAALYVGQIFDAHRVEKGERLEPRPGWVQLRFDRLTAVSMMAGRPRAGLYDDFSLAAMVRASTRVRVGLADASVKLGPEQTVLQLGARATAQLFGPTPSHPLRRFSIAAGGGVLGQVTTRRRTERSLDPAQDPSERVERAGGAVPYVLADARLFVAPRWSVGALGRFGVPLTVRRYAAGRALPAFAPTLELGVSLGVNL